MGCFKSDLFSEIAREQQCFVDKDVDAKLAMLLSLTVPSRCSELAARDLRFRRFYPEGVVFNLAALTKTVRTGQVLKACFHARFNEDLDLCPCACLEEYERRTSVHRTRHLEEPNILFLSVIKPFKPVSSSTIARWIKEILALSGIDTDIFKAHSTRVLQLLLLLTRVCLSQRFCNLEIGHRLTTSKNFIIDLNLTHQLAVPFCLVAMIRVCSFKRALLN